MTLANGLQVKYLKECLADAMDSAKVIGGFEPHHHIPEDSKLGRWTRALSSQMSSYEQEAKLMESVVYASFKQWDKDCRWTGYKYIPGDIYEMNRIHEALTALSEFRDNK